MKKIFFLSYLFFIQFFQVSSFEPKLQEIIKGLYSPWSISFINKNKVLVCSKKYDYDNYKDIIINKLLKYK